MQKVYLTIILILLSLGPTIAKNRPPLPDTIRTNSGKIYVAVNNQDYTAVLKDTFIVKRDSFVINEPAMADVLYSNGKIYVVVLVLATIFAGIVLLQFRMNRKISKLEKDK
jgi:hypothetical protein